MADIMKQRRSLSWRIRDGWEIAKFSYKTFIAPWPPFTIFLVVLAAVNVVTPIAIVYATSGLIDAVTAVVGTGSVGSDEPLLTLVGSFMPWIGFLLALGVPTALTQAPRLGSTERTDPVPRRSPPLGGPPQLKCRFFGGALLRAQCTKDQTFRR